MEVGNFSHEKLLSADTGIVILILSRMETCGYTSLSFPSAANVSYVGNNAKTINSCNSSYSP
jgi:hypothetical protein